VSALVVLVPDAESLVAEFRRAFDRAAREGLGAHITIMFPFRAPESLSPAVISDLRTLFGECAPFTFSLARVDRFPAVVYLAPEPREAFGSLTRIVMARFPECVPYGGEFPELIPHLTVAQQPPAEDLIAIEAEIRRVSNAWLPLHGSATEVSLVVRRGGRWSCAERFALGPPTGDRSTRAPLAT
jgi:2'-5' RNA ligase